MPEHSHVKFKLFLQFVCKCQVETVKKLSLKAFTPKIYLSRSVIFHKIVVLVLGMIQKLDHMENLEFKSFYKRTFN